MKYNSESSRFGRSRLALSVATALSLSAGLATAAQAQDEASATAQEITVTGSRIRRDDFSNPTPTTVVGGEMMENLGIVNVGDAMSQLPSNVASSTPTATANSSFFTGSNIANLRGLNPYFGTRTLTLVDSRRHVPTNQGDGVDLNFIPSVLIDRMEVVTGGASASYGSGAIAGVNNILLDRDLEGGKVQIDFGQTAEGDGDDTHYGLAWGTSLFQERGHLVVAAEGQKMDPIGNCADSRDWCAQGVFEMENPTWNDSDNDGYNDNPSWDGRPRYLRANGGRLMNTSTTGVINSSVGPLPGSFYPDYFDPDAAYVANGDGTGLAEFDSGFGRHNASGGTVSGGDGDSVYALDNLRSEVERETFFGAFDYDITDSLNFFFEASMGTVDTYIPQGSLADNGRVIASDNYYLQQLGGIPADVTGASAGGVYVSKDWSAQANTGTAASTDLKRFATGLSGSFGDSSWTWDAYYQYGESERVQEVIDNRHLNRYTYAIDVIDDGNGNPICRVTADGNPSNDPLAEGCVPLNIFGNQPLSADAKDYSFGFLKETTTVEQELVEAVASGELFQGFDWNGGPIMAAVGASWREESIANIAGEEGLSDAERTDYLIQFGDSFSGEVEVIEYFAELDIPILDNLDMQLAARRSEYENTAGAGTPTPGESYEYEMDTWKVNLNYAVTDWLTLRYTQSDDARAPNFRELYYRQQIQPGGLFGFCDNQWTGDTRDMCGWDLNGGSTTGLEAEESNTQTIGFVVQPFDWGLRFAADYYEIEMEDAITPASTAAVLEGCYETKDPFYCNQIEGELLDPNDPVGGFSDISWLRPTAFNYSSYNVRGIDLSADWVGEYEFGTIAMRWIGSRTIEQTVQVDATNPELDRSLAGITGDSVGFLSNYAAAPDFTAQWITTYMKGPWTITAQARFINSGLMQPLDDRQAPNQKGYDPAFEESTDRNTVPSATYWNLTGTYDFDMAGAQMSAFASINNLFDKEPPLTGGAEGVGGSANAIHFDTLGRAFRVGLRAEF